MVRPAKYACYLAYWVAITPTAKWMGQDLTYRYMNNCHYACYGWDYAQACDLFSLVVLSVLAMPALVWLMLEWRREYEQLKAKK